MNMLILGIMVVVAVAMVVYSVMPNKEEKEDAVRRRSEGISKDQDVKTLQSRTGQRASKHSMFQKAAPILSRPVMPKGDKDQTTLRSKLASAGFRQESVATLFLASKTVAALACGLVGALLAVNADKEMLNIVGQGLFGAAVGFMLPNLWLSMSIKKRSEIIRNGLPDSLDLMVIGVESGLGLDAALLRVSDEMRNVYPPLSEEFQIATVETQMGVPRAEALFKMAERSAVLEMRALVATITQAEKMGTSIAKTLRTQADSLRTKRRQKAEERAQKTAVKLLFPLILFIFPTIFIVLAGPAAIQLISTFSDGGPLTGR